MLAISYKKYLLGLVLSIFVSTYANALPADSKKGGMPLRLQEMHKETSITSFDKEGAVKQLRLKALKQASFSWGVQEGLYWRNSQIKDILESQAIQLDSLNFNKFFIDGKLLLPSVAESERIFHQESNSVVRTVNVSYTLSEPAKFMLKPPSWRDYLYRSVDKPVQPHDALFPRTENEKQVWNNGLTSGWGAGVEQANGIYEIDIRRFQKDIEGRYRFRKLLAQGIVTMPSYSSSHYSVLKLDNGKTINLNDVIYAIKSQSGFTDTDKWEPYFRTGAGRK